jgi:MbtH protein
MTWDEHEDLAIYKVVINHEEQFSIWPADRENPLGWRDAGKSGAKTECLAHIKAVWTDMRPLSVRQWREQPSREE